MSKSPRVECPSSQRLSSQCPSFKYPSFQSAYPIVCVTSQPTSGVSASEFIGKAGTSFVQSSAFVSRQLPSEVLRPVRHQFQLRNELREVAFAYGQPAPHRLAPKDTLPGVFKRQRQAASSSAFQSMRRRFATPSVAVR